MQSPHDGPYQKKASHQCSVRRIQSLGLRVMNIGSDDHLPVGDSNKHRQGR